MSNGVRRCAGWLYRARGCNEGNNYRLSGPRASRRIRASGANREESPLSITPDTIAQVANLLGREPRGLEEIAVTRPDGQPAVIRVASLVDDKPFPTLFWLIVPELCERFEQVEARGPVA